MASNYLLALLLLFAGLGVVVFGAYLLLEWHRKRWIHEIETMPFSEIQKAIVSRTPHFQRLSASDQEKIERSILLFIHTKDFVGVGLDVTEEMKVIIAFYACLLLVHKEVKSCYDELKTIVIYPHAVIVKEVKSAGGIYTKQKFVIQGQSANDTVVITWHEAKKEAYHLRHNNVIIHEFAHEIDFMDGYIDGVPPLEKSKYDGWVNTFYKEYNTLNEIAFKDRGWGKYKLLGAYAASNEAEFFAVVTERFFEAPGSLKQHFPNLYNELKDFYQIDTAKLLS